MLAWLVIACTPAEVPADPQPEGCPWGALSARPSATDPRAAVLELEPSRSGAGAIAGRPDVPLEAGVPTAVVVRDLPPDGTSTLTATVAGEACTAEVTLGPLLPDWPEPVIDVPAAAPGEGLWCLPVSVDDLDVLDVWTCLDRDGVQRRSLVHPTGAAQPVVAELDDGSVWTVALPGTAARYDPVGDPLPDLAVTTLATRFVHDALDRHEALVLDEGPWAGAIALLTTTREVVDGEEVQANGIVVVDPETDAVLWDWSLHGVAGDGQTIDPALLPYDRVPLDPGPLTDWAHANALVHEVEPGGTQAFWMSLRAHDWILKIRVETDEIVWRLGWEGDFTLLDPGGAELSDSQWFFHQHAPVFVGGDPGRVLVYDNGNVRADDGGGRDEGAVPYSRVVELVLDEDARTATLTWAYGADDPADPAYFFSRTQGSVVPLDADGSVVGVLQHDGDGPVIVEVDRDGAVQWQGRFPGRSPSYRAGWFGSLYQRR